jgi:hypothetical protein
VGELARIDDQAQTLTTPSAISNTNNVDQRALAIATLTRAGATPLGAP